MDFRTAFNKRAVQLLYREDNILRIPGVVSNIEKELHSLKGFLGNAEERQGEDEVVREWMSRIKDLVAEAHEITEKHLDRIARYRQIQPGFWNGLLSVPRSVVDGAFMSREASKISHLSNQISGMALMMKAYGIEERQVEPTIEIADDPSTIIIKKRMVIGLEEDIEMIEDQLISTGSSASVVVIWGVNGLGKTTLAKEVSNSKRVADHFDAKTWAFVGQEEDRQFPLKDVLENMIGDLDEAKALGELSENDLSERIKQILIKKKCLVILDDLQSAARWDLLKAALSTTESSSKLVVTACDPAVFTCVDSHMFLHQLRLLNFKEKWELFQKITGSMEKGTRGFKTRRVWKQLIEQCSGLPLTLLLFAGLWKGTLSIPTEWRRIVRLHSERNPAPVLEGCNDHDQSTLELEVELVLRSSLRTLRFKLQGRPFRCLLQMTRYPLGLEIPTEELFADWGRGIFKRMRPSTARRCAQKCLDELVGRGLVQVVAEEGGNIKYCQLHSVIRDFSIRVEEDPSSIRLSKAAAFMSGMGRSLDGLGFVSL